MAQTSERGIGNYDHLNEQDPIIDGVINLDEFVQRLVEKNYGVHRFLSALIRARESSPRYQKLKEEFPDYQDKLTEGLKELLERGLY